MQAGTAFQDSDFAGDLEDSKSTSGGTLCIFGSHTFVPVSWMCKKQTAVSHSSTETVKGMYPAPDIHEHFTIHKMATANCVHPHGQLEQP